MIEGGVELSSIPAACTLGVERRTLPGETADGVAAELGALLDRCRAADPELAVTQRTLLVREPFEVDPEAEIAVLVRAAAAAELGAAPATAGGSILGRLRVHRGRGDPDRPLRPARRGRPRDRGVGEPVEHRGRRPRARRRRREVLRVSAVVNPTADRAAVPPAVDDAAGFHRGLAAYAPTPVRPLEGIAAELGLGAVLLKDESDRLGLPAFKVLGASWAVERALRERPRRPHAGHGERGEPRPRRRPRRRAARAPLPRLPPAPVAARSGARRSPARARRSW